MDKEKCKHSKNTICTKCGQGVEQTIESLLAEKEKEIEALNKNYISAVKGRADFRKVYVKSRETISALQQRNTKLVDIAKEVVIWKSLLPLRFVKEAEQAIEQNTGESPKSEELAKQREKDNKSVREVFGIELESKPEDVEEKIRLTEEKKLELILKKFHGHSREQWENELVKEYPYCEIPYLVDIVWSEAQKKLYTEKELEETYKEAYDTGYDDRSTRMGHLRNKKWQQYQQSLKQK